MRLLIVFVTFLLMLSLFGCAQTPPAPSADMARQGGGYRTKVVVHSNAPNAVLLSPSGEIVGNCPAQFLIQWDPKNYVSYWTSAKPNMVVAETEVGYLWRWYVTGTVAAPGYLSKDFKKYLAKWNMSPAGSARIVNQQRAELNRTVNVDIYLSSLSPPKSTQQQQQQQQQTIVIPDTGNKKGPEKGTVMVSSTPQNADVSVDGNYVGNSPCNLPLTEGIHIIEVKLNGYKPYRRELRVISGGEVTIRATLEQK